GAFCSGTVSTSVPVGAESGCLLERSSKGGGVVVAGGAANPVDRFAGRLEEPLRVTHADLLQVGPRSVPGGGGEPGIERPDAEPELGSQLADLDGLVEVGVDVLLDLVDDDVVVGAPRKWCDVGQLAGPVPVDEQNSGGDVGVGMPTEPLDEVQHEVQEGRRT